MRVLVTGASGMLGSTIVEQWRGRHEIYATGGAGFSPRSSWSYHAFDLAATDHSPLTSWATPDLIIHCAAITSVDGCESAPEHALDINGRSVDRLLEAAPTARMLYISSDAVIGQRSAPAREDAATAPTNVYGRSKLLGETLLADRGVAVRTTVVGWNRDPTKQSFVEWIVRTLERGEQITLFQDALFNPIAASALATELEHVAASQFRGLVHISGREALSKYEFGMALATRLGLDTQLIRAGMLRDVSFAAPRSPDQRLDVSMFEETFGRRLPTIVGTIDALMESRP